MLVTQSPVLKRWVIHTKALQKTMKNVSTDVIQLTEELS